MTVRMLRKPPVGTTKSDRLKITLAGYEASETDVQFFDSERPLAITPVSYTHLTLPTIYSV